MKIGSLHWKSMVGVGLALVSGATAFLAATAVSHACGGLFCNSPPPDPFAPLPVAQTGENVVFSIDKDPAGGAPALSAHIQILYAGDAALFSWVVPVDAAPTVTVGTDRLFSTLASLTQPVFTTTSEIQGECLPEPLVPGNFNGGGTAVGAPMASGPTGSPPAAGGVVVSFQGVVGPYETAVISSTDPMALKMWLTDNKYTVTDQASGLIDTYVREGKFFVALRLTNGAGIKAIQPVVLTFRAPDACVPLRLTAIAANPDMQVRLWVLADSRAIPKNFYEMKIDDARIDWLNAGSNYNALVTEAAHGNGGNAFVAEYAGPSNIAAGALWSPGQYDLATLRAAQTPPAYVQALLSMGLGNDSQTLVLLAKYIPMPAAVKAMGITDSQFYGNLAFYWTQYAFAPSDLAALTNEISDKIIEPRHTAETMIDAHPYLTRLNTFISPAEMNKDPLFNLNPDLPDVPLVHTAILRTMCGARQFMACNAPVQLEFPDGRLTWIKTGSTATTCNYTGYDLTPLAKLPAAEMVFQREEAGQGQVVTDNTTMIQAGLALNNNAFPAEQKMFPMTVTKGIGTTSTQGAGCGCGVARGQGQGPGSESPAARALSILLSALGAMGLIGRARSSRRRRGSPKK